MKRSPAPVDDLLLRIRNGDTQALASLFDRHRDRLSQLIRSRLDQRLSGRVDADDVLQEVYLDASSRIEHFINSHSGSFFVWLRLLTMQTLANVHRRHIDAQARDARREQSIFTGRHYGPGSASIVLQLLSKLTSPSRAAMRDETAQQLEEAVNLMSATDREILTLRHFEQLTNTEVAEVLGIQTKAASIRYIRALTRFKEAISGIPDLSENETTSEAENGR